jgi:hypothetical protein
MIDGFHHRLGIPQYLSVHRSIPRETTQEAGTRATGYSSSGKGVPVQKIEQIEPQKRTQVRENAPRESGGQRLMKLGGRKKKETAPLAARRRHFPPPLSTAASTTHPPLQPRNRTQVRENAPRERGDQRLMKLRGRK